MLPHSFYHFLVYVFLSLKKFLLKSYFRSILVRFGSINLWAYLVSVAAVWNALSSINFVTLYLSWPFLLQLLSDDSSQFRLKLKVYILDFWNILDVITILSFVTGIILKVIPDSPSCFEASRIILALNLMVFYFRILHIFSVHKELGPKLVMIGKMVSPMSSLSLITSTLPFEQCFSLRDWKYHWDVFCYQAFSKQFEDINRFHSRYCALILKFKFICLWCIKISACQLCWARWNGTEAALTLGFLTTKNSFNFRL